MRGAHHEQSNGHRWLLQQANEMTHFKWVLAAGKQGTKMKQSRERGERKTTAVTKHSSGRERERERERASSRRPSAKRRANSEVGKLVAREKNTRGHRSMRHLLSWHKNAINRASWEREREQVMITCCCLRSAERRQLIWKWEKRLRAWWTRETVTCVHLQMKRALEAPARVAFIS